jgi:hypothetical protein
MFLIEAARLAITGKNPPTLEAARKELGADRSSGSGGLPGQRALSQQGDAYSLPR